MTISLSSHFTGAVLRRKARVALVAITLLTLMGPFGTYEALNAGGRVIYWSIALVVSGIIFEVSVPGFLYNPRLARKLCRWPRFLVGVLTGSFFALWVVVLVEYVARGPLDLELLPLLYVYVVVIGAIICFFSFMPPFAQAATSPGTSDIDVERIAFFRTHPHLKGSRLRWITMEDHYARVVLDTGEVTLHASMRELEQQLENYPGMRVHRSHWVANDAMQSIGRNGRSMMITVDGGVRLPLGGTYQKRVEAVYAEMAEFRAASRAAQVGG